MCDRCTDPEDQEKIKSVDVSDILDIPTDALERFDQSIIAAKLPEMDKSTLIAMILRLDAFISYDTWQKMRLLEEHGDEIRAALATARENLNSDNLTGMYL